MAKPELTVTKRTFDGLSPARDFGDKTAAEPASDDPEAGSESEDAAGPEARTRLTPPRDGSRRLSRANAAATRRDDEAGHAPKIVYTAHDGTVPGQHRGRTRQSRRTRASPPASPNGMAR